MNIQNSSDESDKTKKINNLIKYEYKNIYESKLYTQLLKLFTTVHSKL